MAVVKPLTDAQLANAKALIEQGYSKAHAEAMARDGFIRRSVATPRKARTARKGSK
jgi:hypothetical protein